jgi:polyphosphate glucokinase
VAESRLNQLLLEVIRLTRDVFSWDHLYLGGGNTKKITVKLPKDVSIVSNDMGLLGGAALWKV